APQPVAGKQIQHLDIDDLILTDLLLLHLQADDDAGKCPRLAGVRREHDFDLLAARLHEQRAESRIAGQIERKTPQCLIDGLMAIVTDGANPSAAEVLEDEAFQEIVDIRGLKRQIDASTSIDFTFAMKVADTGTEKDHLADGQRRRRLRRGETIRGIRSLRL